MTNSNQPATAITKEIIKSLKVGSVIGNGHDRYLICIKGKCKKTLLDLETYKIVSLKEFDNEYFSSFVFFF